MKKFSETAQPNIFVKVNIYRKEKKDEKVFYDDCRFSRRAVFIYGLF